jgi:hypothetical protein
MLSSGFWKEILGWVLKPKQFLKMRVVHWSGSPLVLPAIALAEAVWIVERGKTSIPSVTALMNAISADPRVTIATLDQAVIQQTIGLSVIHEMHDRQIVATALLLQNQGETVSLLTCDQNITASGLVSVLW